MTFALPHIVGESQSSKRARIMDRVREVDSLDSPFVGLNASRFTEWESSVVAASAAAVRREAAGGGADSAGLVFTKNKSHGVADYRSGVPAGAERTQIDPQARRLKRMRTGVDQSIRLVEDELADLGGGQRWKRLVVTLTYSPDKEWERKHVTGFVAAAKEWAKRRGFRMRYVWVAELQERGALHYHVAMWIPRRFMLPNPDGKRGWWKHGMSNVTKITGGSAGMCGYLSKYATKMGSDEASRIPPRARIHGEGGLLPEAKRAVRYWKAPYWVRDYLSGRADIRRTLGGWMDRRTGLFLESPWRVSVDAAGRVWAVKVERKNAH